MGYLNGVSSPSLFEDKINVKGVKIKNSHKNLKVNSFFSISDHFLKMITIVFYFNFSLGGGREGVVFINYFEEI